MVDTVQCKRCKSWCVVEKDSLHAAGFVAYCSPCGRNVNIEKQVADHVAMLIDEVQDRYKDDPVFRAQIDKLRKRRYCEQEF